MEQSSAFDISRGVMLDALGIAAAFPGSAPADVVSASSKSTGFDFLHGRWAVTHRKLRERLAGNHDWFEFPGTLEVALIPGGAGNIDHNLLEDPTGRYQASSLRLFDADAKRWTIWWLETRCSVSDPPVIGGFDGRKGSFFSDDHFRGHPIRVRTTYEPLSPDRAEWTQAFSADHGANWEINWIMDFRRA